MPRKKKEEDSAAQDFLEPAQSPSQMGGCSLPVNPPPTQEPVSTLTNATTPAPEPPQPPSPKAQVVQIPQAVSSPAPKSNPAPVKESPGQELSEVLLKGFSDQLVQIGRTLLKSKDPRVERAGRKVNEATVWLRNALAKGKGSNIKE